MVFVSSTIIVKGEKHDLTKEYKTNTTSIILNEPTD